MTERVAQLPWSQLYTAEGNIPWPALETFAELVPTDHELVKALFHAYDEARATPFDEPRYVDLYVPAIFALAAPGLSDEQRREIGESLVKRLVEAAREDDDLIAEVMVAVCGSMGPVILPAVLDAISKEPDSLGAWFYLWDLTALAAETEDSDLREQTVQACVALLGRVDRGEVDTDIGMGAGWTLAYLGRTEYTEFLQRLSRKSARIAGGADYEAAARLLQGRQEFQRQPEIWQAPVQEWLTPHWEAARDWFAQRSAEALEDLEVVEADVPEPQRLIRLFVNSPWATGLPEDLLGEAPFIIGRLLEYAETYEGTAATDLDERTLHNVLLDVFPRKLTGDRDFFAKVGPVTEAFLGWMDFEGLLPNASALVQMVHGWTQEIVTTAMDPKRWGPAKSETMKAVQTGVNVSDEDALQGFLFEQALRSLEEMSPADMHEPPVAPSAPIREHTPKVGRNAPCPCGSGRKYKKCCGRSTTDLTANT